MPLETVNFMNKNTKDGETFTPTPEEIQTIRKKMDDPKFLKLFQEYMKSMEDPETRREEEAYLEQVEREAREGGDYSFDFVFPRPGFVVELLEAKTSYRVKATSSVAAQAKKHANTPVYINMCSSEKIDPFREETTGDRNSSNWFVPVSISKPRTELFSEEPNRNAGEEGQEVESCGPDAVVVYDAVFHPHTLQLADRSDRFCCFLVNIAVEHINTGYGDNHGFQFRRLSSDVASVGSLQNQTVRREKGKSPFELAANEPVLKRPTQKLPQPLEVAEEKSGRGSSSEKGIAGSVGCRSDGNKGKDKKVISEEAKGSSTRRGTPEEENMPQYTIAHRGHIDLSDTWGWKIVDRRIGVPEALVVKMEFVGLQSSSALDVEVEGMYVKIARSNLHNYHGSLLLPFTVEPTPLEAKFERKRSTLTLVLRVVPPAPTGVSAADMRQQLMGSCTADAPMDADAGGEQVLNDHHTDGKKADTATVDDDANPTTESEDVHTGTAVPNSMEKNVERREEDVSTPQFSTMSDQERVRQVMEKVQAARRERERVEREEIEKKSGENRKDTNTDTTVTEGCALGNGAVVDSSIDHNHTPVEAATVMPAATAAVPPSDGPSDERRKEEELETLRRRQDAWRQGVQQRLDMTEEEERQEAQRVEREAQREAERLKRRANAAKLQEAAEAKLRECMNEVPLSNKHIFTID
ncbi:pre-RNA processing PIH1/Nop17, putative [Trypanosoma equiperdum]|uniref:PIH1 N-terminal domain-containing protein n=2 Tax=Trypanozoon TaxID=39700 RepID=Q388W0_TRYB2|nr:hypothetical protein, conserved [Trypanosoma brucei brucei TREU927]EAN78660.1 hypothetical protein, conserved [Trypanosoma brucei brucei TREU927]SCU64231.1 pre-RNA processing PIH1/Nop17, putative [Trypanosoma equiperdum]